MSLRMPHIAASVKPLVSAHIGVLASRIWRSN